MNISKETPWVLEQAFLDKDLHVDFVEKVYDYVIANMYEGGELPKGNPSNYVFNLIDTIKDIKADRHMSKSQVNDACREIIRIFRDLGLTESHLAKYDVVPGDEKFLDFITDEIPKLMEDQDELYPNSLYIALAMVSLYYYAFSYDPGNVRLSVIKAALLKADFMNLFRGLDYQKDADSLMEEYKKLKGGDTEIDPFVFKDILPVDTSHLPDFLLEDNPEYIAHDGKWYLSSEVAKAITASSQTAQALERQDLEPTMTSVGLTDSERTSTQIIEGFKLRRKKHEEAKKRKVEEDGRTAD